VLNVKIQTERVDKVSVVVPVYKGETFLDELCGRVRQTLEGIGLDFELILVNDASPDRSWDMILRQCQNDRRMKGLNLSRNFGQHYAITAGLTFVCGDWVVVMDCDLQDRPEDIPALYGKALEGYDSVFAQRLVRQDSWFKRVQSKMFYSVFGYLTDTEMDCSVANFGIYRRNVIEAILSMNDQVRFFPTMVQWVGFRSAKCPVQHEERKQGRSSYTLQRLMRLAGENVIAFSDKPLRLCIGIGLWIAAAAFVVATICFVARVLDVITLSGFTSLMISVWFIGGILMMALGLVGVYIGKTFDQVKGRPTFIVAQSVHRGEDA